MPTVGCVCCDLTVNCLGAFLSPGRLYILIVYRLSYSFQFEPLCKDWRKCGKPNVEPLASSLRARPHFSQTVGFVFSQCSLNIVIESFWLLLAFPGALAPSLASAFGHYSYRFMHFPFLLALRKKKVRKKGNTADNSWNIARQVFWFFFFFLMWGTEKDRGLRSWHEENERLLLYMAEAVVLPGVMNFPRPELQEARKASRERCPWAAR